MKKRLAKKRMIKQITVKTKTTKEVYYNINNEKNFNINNINF